MCMLVQVALGIKLEKLLKEKLQLRAFIGNILSSMAFFTEPMCNLRL